MYYFEDEEDDQPETIDDRLFHIKSCLSTTINLSLLDLTAFPDVVFDYPQVTVLHIGALTSLSKKVGNSMLDFMLTKSLNDESPDYQFRDLATNFAEIREMMQPAKTIGRLPERIHELINLEELNLMGQQLTELPESLCDLPKLKRLYLSKNQLTELPKNISRLRSLVCLDVRANPIQTWPEDFWDMPFIIKYQNDLKKAEERETALLLQKEYKVAMELRQEALRWGLHR